MNAPRAKPPLDADDATWNRQLTLDPIGVVRSPYVWHIDAPRQGTTERDLSQDPGYRNGNYTGIIELHPDLHNGLKDLAGFQYCWVLFWIHHARGWNITVQPPRDDRHHGVFATRSPHRPNPIGLSAVRLLWTRGNKVYIRDHDLLHGTPVLDLKPYLPYCDAFPTARAGWVDELPASGRDDHRRG